MYWCAYIKTEYYKRSFAITDSFGMAPLHSDRLALRSVDRRMLTNTRTSQSHSLQKGKKSNEV